LRRDREDGGRADALEDRHQRAAEGLTLFPAGNRVRFFDWSMILSENRRPLFRIML
jgi:hypothetical protein